MTRRAALLLAAAARSAPGQTVEYRLARAALLAETAPDEARRELAAIVTGDSAVRKLASAIDAGARWRNGYVPLEKIDLTRLTGDERRRIDALRMDLEARYDFVLPDSGGRPVRLREQRGHTVLLHFWATWCLPCRREMPALARIHDPGRCRVLAITAETAAETAAFAREVKMPFPVLHDAARITIENFHIGSYPVTIVLDGTGRPRRRLDDAHTEAALREAVRTAAGGNP